MGARFREVGAGRWSPIPAFTRVTVLQRVWNLNTDMCAMLPVRRPWYSAAQGVMAALLSITDQSMPFREFQDRVEIGG